MAQSERKGQGRYLRMQGYILISMVVLFLINPLSGFSSDKLKGLEYLFAKDYENAIICFESDLKKNPDNKEIQKNLVFAYHQLANQYAENNIQMAIEYESKALALDKNNQTLRKNLAIYYNNYALSESLNGDGYKVSSYLKEALKYDPDNIKIRENLSSALTKVAKDKYDKGNFEEAFEILKESITYNDKNWNSHIYLGEILYNRDDLNGAVESWKEALRINPNLKDLEARIKKVAKENLVENKFNVAKFANFKVKFEGYKDTQSAWKILRILEEARYRVGADFKLYPKSPITVIIYTSKQFTTLTSTIDWALGLYDGKIRIKKDEVLKGEKLLRRVLYHEYTHALIYKITKGNIPIWLNEGIAQFEEPQKDKIPLEENWLKGILQRNKLISLSELENIFIAKKDINKLSLAYLEAKLFVCYLVNRYSFYNLYRMLKMLGEGEKFDVVLKRIFYKDLKDLEKEWQIHLEQE